MNPEQKFTILWAILAILGCTASQHWEPVSNEYLLNRALEDAMEFYKTSFDGVDSPKLVKTVSANQTRRGSNQNDFKADIIVSGSNSNLQRCQTVMEQDDSRSYPTPSYKVLSFSCQKSILASHGIIGALLDSQKSFSQLRVGSALGSGPSGLPGAASVEDLPVLAVSAQRHFTLQANNHSMNARPRGVLAVAHVGQPTSSNHFLLDFEVAYRSDPNMQHTVTCFYSLRDERDIDECQCDEVSRFSCK